MKNYLCIFLTSISLFTAAQSAITWTAGMNIASSSYGNYHPRIVTDGSGDPLVIWGRSSDASVFISRWNGSSFTTPVKINPAWLSVASASWMGPDIASKGDTVYVVMKRTPESSDTNHIYISRSFNGGVSFSPPVRVDFIADSISRFPTVTTNASGNPIVGFMKFNSSFADSRWVVTKSNDYGSTFSVDVKASGWSGAGALVCDCCPGAIICNGNTVAMAYRDNLNDIRDIWVGISSDGGNSFSQGIPADQTNWLINACPSSGPDEVIIGDTLYSVYMSNASGNSLIYLSKSSLSAMTGSAGVPLTGLFSGLALQNYPRITSSGSALAMVWKQIVNGGEQLALRFTNNVANGFYAGYDTVDINNITNTDVILTNGNIFVVWQDDASGTVKYRRGTFIPSVNIEEPFSEEQFSLFPNPSAEEFQIQTAMSGNSKCELRIYDILGKEKEIEFTKNQNGFLVRVKNLKPGVYLIKLNAESKVNYAKLQIVSK